MPETRWLAPHDPLPDGLRHVVVMRRFAEDDPRRTDVEIIVVHGPDRTRVMRPAIAGDHILTLTEAVREGEAIAAQEGFAHVFVIDRTAGPRERDVLAHGGDHSVHMERLQDSDEDDGERGSDMRDRGRHDMGR
ncbi:MAG TPA: hypothetical protein VJY39_22200 [Acidisphaera sp.]|nr:hypothetical protein [Acidisphaera sp.]